MNQTPNFYTNCAETKTAPNWLVKEQTERVHRINDCHFNGCRV